MREGEFDVAREALAKLFAHYAVDLTTVWHLTRELSGDQHRIGEEDIAKIAPKALATPITPLVLPDPKSLYRSATKVAEDTVRSQLDRVLADQKADNHLHDKDLMTEMIRHCASFGLACFLYAWRYIERA